MFFKIQVVKMGPKKVCFWENSINKNCLPDFFWVKNGVYTWNRVFILIYLLSTYTVLVAWNTMYYVSWQWVGQDPTLMKISIIFLYLLSSRIGKSEPV